MSIIQSSKSPEISSPASENSVYFDAPPMNLFSRKRSAADPANVPIAGGAANQGNGLVGQSFVNGHVPKIELPDIIPDPQVNPGIIEPPVIITTTVVDDQPAAALPQPPSHSDEQKASEPNNPVPTADATTTYTGAQRTEPTFPSGKLRRHRSKSSNKGGDVGREKEDEDFIKPIPVVWSGNEGGFKLQDQAGGSLVQRSNSNRTRTQSPWIARSMNGSISAANRGADQESVTTGRSGGRTPHRRMSIGGGTFAAGPGTVGPNSMPELDGSFHERSVLAEASLNQRQRSRIGKVERKENKKMAAVIKAESKAEKESLEIAVKELTEVQKMQKAAVKGEAKMASAHARALRTFRKEELDYFTARAKYERAQADLQSQEDLREASRSHAQEATELLQEKHKEVEYLRAQKAADERERELRLLKLMGKA